MKNLVWFRNDLRISDHEALHTASVHGTVIPLYCFDPRHFALTKYGFSKTGAIRATFLIESVTELRKRLNGRLIVRIGMPETIIPELINKLNIEGLYYNSEVTDEELHVEKAIKQSVSIPVYSFHGSTLYHPDDLPFPIEDLPDVFTTFRKMVEKQCLVRKPYKEVRLEETFHPNIFINHIV